MATSCSLLQRSIFGIVRWEEHLTKKLNTEKLPRQWLESLLVFLVLSQVPLIFCPHVNLYSHRSLPYSRNSYPISLCIYGFVWWILYSAFVLHKGLHRDMNSQRNNITPAHPHHRTQFYFHKEALWTCQADTHTKKTNSQNLWMPHHRTIFCPNRVPTMHGWK